MDDPEDDIADASVPGVMHFTCNLKHNKFCVCLQKLDSFSAHFCIPSCVSSLVLIKSSKFRKFNFSYSGTEYSSSPSFEEALLSTQTGVCVSVSL